MARNAKASAQTAADKPPSIPQLIQRYNDASIRAKDAKRDADSCRDPLKAWAQKVGNQIEPSKIRAEQTIDGYTCIVHLGLASGFEPDVAAVIAQFGVDACLAAGLLGVKVDALRELASKSQVDLKDLGQAKEATISIKTCEAVKVKR